MTSTPSPAAIEAIEAGMLDECAISAPGTETYNPATNGLTPSAGAVGYSGRCSVAAEAAIGGAERARGGEAETERPYQVSIPRNAAPIPRVGHLVAITAVHAEGDPQLLEKTLVIRRIRFGTRMARRILLCDLIEASA